MGSIEIIQGEESRGIPVQAATPDAVPTIVEAVYGLRNVTPAEVIGGAVACWDAETDIGASTRVVLWEEPPLPAPLPQPTGGT